MLSTSTDKEDCKFKETYLLSYLQCPKCDRIFRNPLRMHPCGHTFCQSCSPQAGSLCYNCGQVVQVRQTDLTSSNLIADLSVACKAQGCPFKGSFQQFKSNHQQNCPIRKSGGLDCWIEDMQSTLNNLKYAKIKESQPQSQNLQSQRAQNQGEINNEMLNYDLSERRNRSKPSNLIQKSQSHADETFIECIPLDTERPMRNTECMQLEGSQLFVNAFFKPKKQSKLIMRNVKGKNIIEL